MFISVVLSEFEINEIGLYLHVYNVYFICLIQVRDKRDPTVLTVEMCYVEVDRTENCTSK